MTVGAVTRVIYARCLTGAERRELSLLWLLSWTRHHSTTKRDATRPSRVIRPQTGNNSDRDPPTLALLSKYNSHTDNRSVLLLLSHGGSSIGYKSPAACIFSFINILHE